MAERVKSSAAAAPEGGWGWMIVASCFITTICTRAVTRCVSIFFVEFHMHFSSDYSSTAWIHSLVDCTTMLCAPLGSSIGNHFSCRVAVMVGGLLSSAGLILSSFATSLEYLYLSLGILTGVGFALCYTPAVAIVGTYFSERKALAYGIAMSGSGIGTFILAPVVQLLIEIYSWQGALLILGGLVSHLCVCGALMRPLGTHKQKHSGKDREVDMLYSQLAGDELHMELNLEEAKAPDEELDGSAVTVRVTSRETTEEYEPDEEQEQESLLKNGEKVITNSNQEEAKFIDSSQRDTTLKEKKCPEESTEEQMVADIDMKNYLNDIESKLPGVTKGIWVKNTSTYTNSKSTSLSESAVSNQETQLDTLKSGSVLLNSKLADTKQTNLPVTDSKLQSVSADSKLAGLRPTESMLADSEPNDSTLASLSLDDLVLSDLKLAEPVHADSELSSSKLAGSIQADPERNDSKLAELMLVDSALTDLKLEAKLADSRLLCKMTFCESLNFPTKNKATESGETYLCVPSVREYSFLLLPDFLPLSVSFLFLAFGCSVPFVYLVPYSHSVGVCNQQAALLMSILGVMGIVGNITFGWISDRKCLRAYRKVSYLLAVAFDGLGCLFVPLLRNFSLLVPFALVYGYFDGAYVALLPVVTSDTVGPTYLSSALAVVCFLHAIPYLISPPIGGWLVDQTGSYTAAFLLSGFSLICSALILAVVTLVRSCSKRPSQSYLK